MRTCQRCGFENAPEGGECPLCGHLVGGGLDRSSDDTPTVDEGGRITLPEMVRAQLHGAPRIAVEIRPEGVLLRPETDQVDDTSAILQEMVPQDAPPERRRFRLFRRKRKVQP